MLKNCYNLESESKRVCMRERQRETERLSERERETEISWCLKTSATEVTKREQLSPEPKDLLKKEQQRTVKTFTSTTYCSLVNSKCSLLPNLKSVMCELWSGILSLP